MIKFEQVVYRDFLGNEYDGEDRVIALEQENKRLSDVAKMVMYSCDQHDEDCTRIDENGVKHTCPFHNSNGECAFREKFGDNEYDLPTEWEFENNSRFENEEFVCDMFH